MTLTGWLYDLHPHESGVGVVAWLWRNGRCTQIHDPDYTPAFLVSGERTELDDLQGRLEEWEGVRLVEPVERRLALEDPRVHYALRVVPRRIQELQQLARTVDRFGKYHRFTLFDVDLKLSQRYLVAKGISPMSLIRYDGGGSWTQLEDIEALDYPVPAMTVRELAIRSDAPLGRTRPKDPIVALGLDDDVIEGSDEAEVIAGFGELLARVDPVVLYSRNGDDFALSYVTRRAQRYQIDLPWNRTGSPLRIGKGKSYMSYGVVVYRPPAIKLQGRIHIDTKASFNFRAGGFAGLMDISRQAQLPMQESSRVTSGGAVSAMEVNQALREGIGVMWKKNIPESFKSAETLLVADRGGFYYEPAVGVHTRILEVDFFSLYPSIMARYNISPETLLCECCPGELQVPEIGYNTCIRTEGLIPRVIDHILKRRGAYKRMKRQDGPNQAVYAERDALYKWLLVTSFGYTGYKNARFGRIECHQAITAWGRELLFRAARTADAYGYEVIHGIVDSLWLNPLRGAGDEEKMVARIEAETRIPMEIEGWYDWVVFVPGKGTGVGVPNRYYGKFSDGELKLRGIEVRKHDTCEWIRSAQYGMLKVLRQASDERGLRECIPEAITVLKDHAEKLVAGTVPNEDMIMGRRVAKRVEEYRVMSHAKGALLQLRQKGFEINPGEKVEFMITEARSRNWRNRVVVKEFMTGDERPDVREYRKLLARSGETLLGVFGWTEDGLMREMR